jgi:hypothetical protein
LRQIIDQARAAITEGRDAVQGLPSSTVFSNHLARAIREVGKGLAAEQEGENSPAFDVRVEGESRELPLLVEGRKSTALPASHYAMRSGIRRRDGSESRSITTSGSFG